jgi:DNA repair protein RecO (recombination protein O)
MRPGRKILLRVYSQISLTTDTTAAIILRVKELGESDLLISFFTPRSGRLSGVAKGARKSRKRFVNALDLFSLVNLEYASRRQGNLFLLHSAKLIDPYAGLRADYASLSTASYMIELTEILFPPGVAEPGMFQLLTFCLDALSKGDKSELVPLIFEFKAMSLGGYRIDAARCKKCGRPYRAEGTAVFRREQGGIACLKCCRPSAVAPPLKPLAVKAVNTLQNQSFGEAMELTLDEDTMKALRGVLKLHREYRLEQRLRTSKYVE